jgi:hypothetical protein
MGLKYSAWCTYSAEPGARRGLCTVSARRIPLLRMLAALRPYTRSFSMTVNHANVDMQTELHDGDEVACVPQVRGG